MLPAGKITAHDLLAQRESEHLAPDALKTWAGAPADCATLLLSVRVSRELTIDGFGNETSVVDEARTVLRQCEALPPGSAGVDAHNLDVLRRLIACLEAQRAAAGLRGNALAVLRVVRRVRRGR